MYSHINRDQRIALGALLYAGHNQVECAQELSVSPSTISRELKRNAKDNGRYHSWTADIIARKKRKESKKKYRKIENDLELTKYIESRMNPLCSPEVIAHELKIAHETIYTWIDRARPDLKKLLPYRGKKRHRYGGKREEKQGWTKNVRPIDERPHETVSWEGDTITGTTRARILTHVERTSLFLVADLMKNGTADTVHETMAHHQKIQGVVTYDRGSEFALWKMIERDTNANIYFAHAHHPWERGKNENTNGRLRRVFPKRFNFNTITQNDLDCVVNYMNNTPRKSLSWQTPAEVFKRLCCTSG